MLRPHHLPDDSGASNGRCGTPLLVLFLVLLLAAAPASAKVYTVNAAAGNVSLQALINSSSSGDSIFLAPGTYYENIVIDRSIVFGALDTGNPPEIVAPAPDPGITLAADGITLNGITISGKARDGLLVASNNNRVTSVTIAGLDRGIALTGARSNIISGNTILNNTVGVEVDRSSVGNIFYLNTFGNTVDVSSASSSNPWFSDHQDYQYNGKTYSGPLGNYWKGYAGMDANGDGIGDTPRTIQSYGSGMPQGTASEDKAPLVSPPSSYTLLALTSPFNSTAPSSLLNRGDQNGAGSQNPPFSGQQGTEPLPSDTIPGGMPGVLGGAGSPPSQIGMFLVQYWWIIPVAIVVSIIGGIWFERTRKKARAPVHDEIPEGTLTRNTVVVKRPSPHAPASENAAEEPYYTVRLPPSLEKKYPGAEYLGEGGVGRVFKAWDPKEGRHIAVKVPARFDEITGTQFTKELHIWQGLHHKNIVEIYAANVFPMPYIEMEFIETSLATLKFPLDPGRATAIIRGVSEGLAYAHGLGIVHRDIKPENILITADGIPKITDWGLAKAMTDTKHTGLISFSLNYAAPEQLAPNIYGEAGQWTDIYQLGVLYYEMVTGKLPFIGSGMGEVTHAILHDMPEIPALEGSNAGLMSSIILKCLQKKPQDRYASVAEIIEDLKKLDL